MKCCDADFFKSSALYLDFIVTRQHALIISKIYEFFNYVLSDIRFLSECIFTITNKSRFKYDSSQIFFRTFGIFLTVLSRLNAFQFFQFFDSYLSLPYCERTISNACS